MLEDLKKDFPGMSEDALKFVAESEEVKSQPDATEQDETEDVLDEVENNTDEVAEEETEENTDIPAVKEEKTVSLKALHEERSKRKAEKARADALSAELDALRKVPTTQPVVEQPVKTQDISALIESQAEKEVREKNDFHGDLDLLQYEDPAKYRKITKEIAKTEFRLEGEYSQRQSLFNENAQFVNELKAIPDFPTVYQFALTELDELPGRKSKEIGSAFERIDRGIGTKEDRETVKSFADECAKKLNGTKEESLSTKPPVSKIAEAAKLPRASQLSGGSQTRALSTAEIAQMLDEGRIGEIPSEVLKKYR